MKDGQPLEASTKNVQSVDGKKRFKLEVSNVTTADIGQYGVTAVGKKCETSASFSLNVTATELWDSGYMQEVSHHLSTYE